ncbi:DbpA RNA-binding domain-containing protein [Candidatus Methylobacter favarea]|uniref:DbpA RNA-binding domain-containing protein n=1 Tax=Candidatus Methylobacter favarea TaxID=2707345 RepID=A0A8S0XVY8_9GAMM|nr:DbpA RNA binding domain-containing protein [Candidatus Methylobacter favarea]CAA9892928.1 DbpA RNA-binding domain-containing protein [Candidatus Methylobacter favarea]
MNISNKPAASRQGAKTQLKTLLQPILQGKTIESERTLIKEVAAELHTDILDCAAALLICLNQEAPAFKHAFCCTPQKPDKLTALESLQTSTKMVRYRLDVGRKNQLTLEELKKVLVEESGVDKNNIRNVNIQADYTLIELPDKMPLDIFEHLKSVEINHHKLDIKRVKSRHKKRRNPRSRQTLQPKPRLIDDGDNKIGVE